MVAKIVSIISNYVCNIFALYLFIYDKAVILNKSKIIILK